MFVYAVFVPGREKAPQLAQGLQPAE
jgi:nitric oxide reductase subunit B